MFHERNCYASPVDDRLLDAAIAVLQTHGYDGLTLERVAERAGRSRVTLWRQQITHEALIDGLLARLTRDYRDLMWPALAEAGTGAERLRSALTALLEVADRQLHLLAVSDDVFTRAADRMRDITGQRFSFLDPFLASLRAAATDASLTLPRLSTSDTEALAPERAGPEGTAADSGSTAGAPDSSLSDTAEALFHSVCWGYVHLRHRQGWPAERARPPILALALAAVGLSAGPPAA
jgi:AcrR family transcriptional regulator